MLAQPAPRAQPSLITHLAFACLGVTALTQPALANSCQGAQIFHCQIGKKSLEVCHDGDLLTYRFGPPNAAELALQTSIAKADFRPWPGIGWTMSQSLVFHNKGTRYEVWSSHERGESEAPALGGVTVEKGDQTLADLHCAPTTVASNLPAVEFLKSDIGQCWDAAEYHWQDMPCE